MLTWLRLLEPELLKLVKQWYGTELRSRTLASIKPEMAQALPSLLDEASAAGDAKVMRNSSFSLPTIPQKIRDQLRPGFDNQTRQ